MGPRLALAAGKADVGDYRSPEVGNIQGVTIPSRLNCLDHPMDHARMSVYDSRLRDIEDKPYITSINGVIDCRGMRDSWLRDIKDKRYVAGIDCVSELAPCR